MRRVGVIGNSARPGHAEAFAKVINGITGTKVEYIYTQDLAVSRRIAMAADIQQVVRHHYAMLHKIDAMVLASDDARLHYDYAEAFIKVGIPVFIDKPLALTVKEAERIFALEKCRGQVFSCSAARYSEEFLRVKLPSEVTAVHGYVPGTWDLYAVHAIEPILQLSGARDIPYKVTTNNDGPIALTYTCKQGTKTVEFTALEGAYRRMFEAFFAGKTIPKDFTLRVIEAIERGRMHV